MEMGKGDIYMGGQKDSFEKVIGKIIESMDLELE